MASQISRDSFVRFYSGHAGGADDGSGNITGAFTASEAFQRYSQDILQIVKNALGINVSDINSALKQLYIKFPHGFNFRAMSKQEEQEACKELVKAAKDTDFYKEFTGVIESDSDYMKCQKILDSIKIINSFIIDSSTTLIGLIKRNIVELSAMLKTIDSVLDFAQKQSKDKIPSQALSMIYAIRKQMEASLQKLKAISGKGVDSYVQKYLEEEVVKGPKSASTLGDILRQTFLGPSYTLHIQEILKKYNISLNELFKSQNINDELNKKILKVLQDNKFNLADRDIQDDLQTLSQLIELLLGHNEGSREDIIKKIMSGDNIGSAIKNLPKDKENVLGKGRGGAKLEDDIKIEEREEPSELEKKIKNKRVGKAITIDLFQKQLINRIYNIYLAVQNIAVKVGFEIPVSEQLLFLKDSLSRIRPYLTRRDSWAALSGQYNDALSLERRETFFSELRHIKSSAQSMAEMSMYKSNGQLFQDLSNTIDALFKLYEQYSDIFYNYFTGKIMKEGHGKSGGANEYLNPTEPYTSYKSLASEQGNDLIQKSPIMLEKEINKMEYYINLAEVNENINRYKKDFDKLNEQYVEKRSKAIAARADEIQYQGKKLKKRLEKTAEYGGYSEADKSTLQKATEFLNYRNDARIGLFKALEAIDDYLGVFHKDLLKNYNNLKSIQQIVDDSEDIYDWYTYDGVVYLGAVYNIFPAGVETVDNQLQRIKDLVKDKEYVSYLYHGDNQIVGDPNLSQKHEELYNLGPDYLSKFLSRFSLLKNILYAFIKCVSKSDERFYNNFMSPSKIYEYLINYLKYCSFILRGGPDLNYPKKKTKMQKMQASRRVAVEAERVYQHGPGGGPPPGTSTTGPTSSLQTEVDGLKDAVSDIQNKVGNLKIDLGGTIGQKTIQDVADVAYMAKTTADNAETLVTNVKHTVAGLNVPNSGLDLDQFKKNFDNANSQLQTALKNIGDLQTQVGKIPTGTAPAQVTQKELKKLKTDLKSSYNNLEHNYTILKNTWDSINRKVKKNSTDIAQLFAKQGQLEYDINQLKGSQSSSGSSPGQNQPSPDIHGLKTALHNFALHFVTKHYKPTHNSQYQDAEDIKFSLMSILIGILTDENDWKAYSLSFFQNPITKTDNVANVRAGFNSAIGNKDLSLISLTDDENINEVINDFCAVIQLLYPFRNHTFDQLMNEMDPNNNGENIINISIAAKDFNDPNFDTTQQNDSILLFIKDAVKNLISYYASYNSPYLKITSNEMYDASIMDKFIKYLTQLRIGFLSINPIFLFTYCEITHSINHAATYGEFSAKLFRTIIFDDNVLGENIALSLSLAYHDAIQIAIENNIIEYNVSVFHNALNKWDLLLYSNLLDEVINLYLSQTTDIKADIGIIFSNIPYLIFGVKMSEEIIENVLRKNSFSIRSQQDSGGIGGDNFPDNFEDAFNQISYMNGTLTLSDWDEPELTNDGSGLRFYQGEFYYYTKLNGQMSNEKATLDVLDFDYFKNIFNWPIYINTIKRLENLIGSGHVYTDIHRLLWIRPENKQIRLIALSKNDPQNNVKNNVGEFNIEIDSTNKDLIIYNAEKYSRKVSFKVGKSGNHGIKPSPELLYLLKKIQFPNPGTSSGHSGTKDIKLMCVVNNFVSTNYLTPNYVTKELGGAQNTRGYFKINPPNVTTNDKTGKTFASGDNESNDFSNKISTLLKMAGENNMFYLLNKFKDEEIVGPDGSDMRGTISILYDRYIKDIDNNIKSIKYKSTDVLSSGLFEQNMPTLTQKEAEDNLNIFKAFIYFYRSNKDPNNEKLFNQKGENQIKPDEFIDIVDQNGRQSGTKLNVPDKLVAHLQLVHAFANIKDIYISYYLLNLLMSLVNYKVDTSKSRGLVFSKLREKLGEGYDFTNIIPLALELAANYDLYIKSYYLRNEDPQKLGLGRNKKHGGAEQDFRSFTLVSIQNYNFKMTNVADAAGDEGFEQKLFSDAVKAMCAKTLTMVEIYKLQTPQKLSLNDSIRTILGGANQDWPDIFPEVVPLYIRSALLLEFYREFFKPNSTDDHTDLKIKNKGQVTNISAKISLIPDFDGDFSEMYKFMFIDNEDGKLINFSKDDLIGWIKIINRIWDKKQHKYKEKDPIRGILNEIIDDINNRYGIIRLKDLKLLLKEQNEGLEYNAYSSLEDPKEYNIPLLPGEQNITSSYYAPSDQYRNHSDSQISITKNKLMDYLSNEYRQMLRNFRIKLDNYYFKNLDHESLNTAMVETRSKSQALPFMKNKTLRVTLNNFSNKISKKTGKEEKFNLMFNLTRSNLVNDINLISHYMFNETVINGLNILSGIYAIIHKFYLTVLSCDVPELIRVSQFQNRANADRGGANLTNNVSILAIDGNITDYNMTVATDKTELVRQMRLLLFKKYYNITDNAIVGDKPTITEFHNIKHVNTHSLVKNTHANATDEGVMWRVILNPLEVLHDIIDQICILSTNFQGLVEFNMRAGEIQLNFNKLQNHVEGLIQNIKFFAEKLQNSVNTDLYEKYMSKTKLGSLYWFQEQFIEKLFKGRKPSQKGVDGSTIVGNKKEYYPLKKIDVVINRIFKSANKCGFATVHSGAPGNNPGIPLGQLFAKMIFYDSQESDNSGIVGVCPDQSKVSGSKNNLPLDRDTTALPVNLNEPLSNLMIQPNNEKINIYPEFYARYHQLYLYDNYWPLNNSLLFALNQGIAKYIRVIYDNGVKKYYRKALSEIVSGPLAVSITDYENNTYPDYCKGAASFELYSDINVDEVDPLNLTYANSPNYIETVRNESGFINDNAGKIDPASYSVEQRAPIVAAILKNMSKPPRANNGNNITVYGAVIYVGLVTDNGSRLSVNAAGDNIETVNISPASNNFQTDAIEGGLAGIDVDSIEKLVNRLNYITQNINLPTQLRKILVRMENDPNFISSMDEATMQKLMEQLLKPTYEATKKTKKRSTLFYSSNIGVKLEDDACPFGRRTDPHPRRLLFSTLGMVLNHLAFTKNKWGSEVYIVDTIGELSGQKQEEMRAYLPLLRAHFSTLVERSKILTRIINMADIDMNRRNLYTHDLSKTDPDVTSDDRKRGKGLMKDSEVDDPRINGTDLKRDGGLDAKMSKKVKQKYTETIDNIIQAADNMRKTIDYILKELNDAPKYLEQRKDSISNYKELYGELPLMPLSNITFIMKPKIGSQRFILHPSDYGTNNFKLAYGFRCLYQNKDLGEECFLGWKDMIEMHNNSGQLGPKIEEGPAKKYLNHFETLSKFINDIYTVKALSSTSLKYYPEIAGLNDTRNYLFDNNARTINYNNVNNNMTELFINYHIPTNSLSDFSPFIVLTNGSPNAYDSGTIEPGSIGNFFTRTLTGTTYGPINNITMQLDPDTDLFKIYRVTELTDKDEAIKEVTHRCFPASKNSENLQIENIVDMNIVPIRVNALSSQIPLSNIMTFSYNFDRICIKTLFGDSSYSYLVHQLMNNSQMTIHRVGANNIIDNIDLNEYPMYSGNDRSYYMLMLINDPMMDVNDNGLTKILGAFNIYDSSNETKPLRFLNDAIFLNVLVRETHRPRKDDEGIQDGHEQSKNQSRSINSTPANGNPPHIRNIVNHFNCTLTRHLLTMTFSSYIVKKSIRDYLLNNQDKQPILTTGIKTLDPNYIHKTSNNDYTKPNTSYNENAAYERNSYFGAIP